MPPATFFCSLLFGEFPAAVAAAYNPRLRGSAYAVVRRSGESHRHAVWSVSLQALHRGAFPGMPVQTLRLRYPDIEVVTYREELHDAAREDLSLVLSRYTPDVTVTRHGACLLDVSRTPLARSARPEQAVIELQADVADRTGLGKPAVGMAASALVAGMLARGALPRGIGICNRGDEAAFICKCETALLPGLSASCRERLRKYGLKFVGQVRELSRRELTERLGDEGERLYCMARGIDARPASAPASVGAETVLDRDTSDRGLLLQHLRRTVDRFCHRVKRARLAVHRARLTIVHTDRKVSRKTVAFRGGTGDYLTVVQGMTAAFDELYVRRVGIRSILVTGTKLDAASGQLELFESQWEAKQRNLGEKIMEVRKKIAFDAVFAGSDYGAVPNQDDTRETL